MQSPSGQASDSAKEEANIFTGSSLTGDLNDAPKEPTDVTSSSSSEDDLNEHDEDDRNGGNANKQLIIYDPKSNGTGEGEIVPEPIQSRRPLFGKSGSNMPAKLLPSVGAFTVQCANCYKWRLIPTKEKYEEIREHVLEDPFFCEKAREWRSDISCDDPTDISQDGSRLWAIDKPNIAQPPRGWQRLLRIRGEGSTKFADVYYEAPNGKRLRSMVEVQKYLAEHPQYAGGVKLSQFSFQIPKPLQENYVRKRPARVIASQDSIKALEPSEVNPLSWVGPDNGTDLPALLPPPSFDALSPPGKKARRTTPTKVYSSNSMFNQQNINVEGPSQS